MTTRQITLDISDKALPAEKMDEASKESPMIPAGTPILGDGVFSLFMPASIETLKVEGER